MLYLKPHKTKMHLESVKKGKKYFCFHNFFIQPTIFIINHWDYVRDFNVSLIFKHSSNHCNSRESECWLVTTFLYFGVIKEKRGNTGKESQTNAKHTSIHLNGRPKCCWLSWFLGAWLLCWILYWYYQSMSLMIEEYIQ